MKKLWKILFAALLVLPLFTGVLGLAMLRNQQHIDADLFALFVRSGVYLDYARQFMRPEQIDVVDVEAVLA